MGYLKYLIFAKNTVIARLKTPSLTGIICPAMIQKAHLHQKNDR